MFTTCYSNSEEPWCISANGTIFRTDVQGVIPGLLEKWYPERQDYKRIRRKQLIQKR